MQKSKYIIPILLRSFGRTGTTMLMQLLGSSEEIVFDKTYPYENRLLAYFFRLSSLPLQNKNNIEIRWNNDSLFKANLNLMGPIPLQTKLITNSKQFRNLLFKNMWKAFSYEILKSNPKSIYYAEKIPLDIPNELNPIMYCKNIFLLRDPRDEMVSIMEFNSKRGRYSFGWEKNDTPVTFAKKMVKIRKSFLNYFINLPKYDERRIKIRYEDMIENIYTESKLLSTWLNVELNPDKVLENLNSHKHHMTSKSPKDSIRRWKTYLSKEVKKIFEQELGEELSKVGYEL